MPPQERLSSAVFSPKEEKRLIPLSLSLVYPILGLHCIEQSDRMRRAAEYIRDVLSPLATSMSGGLPLLRWEEHLAPECASRSKRRAIIGNAAVYLFLAPAVLGLFYGSNWGGTFSATITLLWLSGLGFTVVLVTKHLDNQTQWFTYLLKTVKSLTQRLQSAQLLSRIRLTIEPPRK